MDLEDNILDDNGYNYHVGYNKREVYLLIYVRNRNKKLEFSWSRIVPVMIGARETQR